MNTTENIQYEDPGIYLIVHFEWPDNFTNEHAKLAKKLHDLTQDQDWIRETVAASGGIGGDEGSIWIFWLKNYTALDRLLKDPSDEVSSAYREFFSSMKKVRDYIREKVLFI